MLQKLLFGVCLLLLTSCTNLSYARDLPKPDLMLAKVYHPGIDLNDYWVSEKYDGVRALWNGKQLVSRGGNIYHAPEWFIQDFPNQKLDGELWVGRQQFEEAVSIVRDKRPDDQAWKKVKFMVFDLPDSPDSFDHRIQQINATVNQLSIPWLVSVKQWKVKSHAELMSQLASYTKAGAEGLMLHRGSSFYKGLRNGDLLKVKPFNDAEAKVVSHIKGNGKYKGMLGAMVVVLPDGKRFKIGSGFNDAQRRNPPKIGSTITFRYRGKTKNGLPRFATFLRIRDVEH